MGNTSYTYTSEAQHGGEKQGAAKLGLVGHKIAQEQVRVKEPQDWVVNG